MTTDTAKGKKRVITVISSDEESGSDGSESEAGSSPPKKIAKRMFLSSLTLHPSDFSLQGSKAKSSHNKLTEMSANSEAFNDSDNGMQFLLLLSNSSNFRPFVITDLSSSFVGSSRSTHASSSHMALRSRPNFKLSFHNDGNAGASNISRQVSASPPLFLPSPLWHATTPPQPTEPANSAYSGSSDNLNGSNPWVAGRTMEFTL
jgi:hypothetical protein